jgi:hypothetical protein
LYNTFNEAAGYTIYNNIGSIVVCSKASIAGLGGVDLFIAFHATLCSLGFLYCGTVGLVCCRISICGNYSSAYTTQKMIPLEKHSNML